MVQVKDGLLKVSILEYYIVNIVELEGLISWLFNGWIIKGMVSKVWTLLYLKDLHSVTLLLFVYQSHFNLIETESCRQTLGISRKKGLLFYIDGIQV